MLARPPVWSVSNVPSLRAASEPLLFLYPRWFQQQCRSSARLSRAGRAVSIPSDNDQKCAAACNVQSRPLSQPKPRARRSLHTNGRVELPYDDVKEDGTTSTVSADIREQSRLNSRRKERAGHGDRTQTEASPSKQRKKRHLSQLGRNEVSSLVRYVSLASANVAGENISCETIELTPDVLRSIAGTVTPNMWTHGAGSGCIIQVLPSNKDVVDFHQVELRGSALSREAAKTDLLNHKVPPTLEHPRHSSRTSWARTLHVDDIPPPQQWSVKSFYDFTRLLLSHKPRQAQKRAVYATGESYSRCAGQRLLSMFSSLDSAPFASLGAFRLVLNLFRRHPELHDLASNFWDTAIALGLTPDGECYNEEIGRLVEVKDIDTAVQRLIDMRRANVKPTAETWRLILNRTDDRIIQQKILSAVRFLGLLSTPRDKVKISAALSKKIGPHFDIRRDSVEQLSGYMEHQVGPGWASTPAINRLLRACLVGKTRSHTASAILNQIRSPGQDQPHMDAETVELLLRILMRDGTVQDALILLESSHLSTTRKYDSRIIASLFSKALRKRLLNLSRVLWCYAASRALITLDMKNDMQSALFNNPAPTSNAEQWNWKLNATKFIVGYDLDTEHFQAVFPDLLQSSVEEEVRVALSSFQTTRESRHQQLQLARLLLERDLNLWRFCYPMKWDAFLILLQKAMELDTSQPDLQSKQFPSIQNLGQQLIDIPLNKRAFPIKKRFSSVEIEQKQHWWYVNRHRVDRNTLTFIGQESETQAANAENIATLDTTEVKQVAPKDEAKFHQDDHVFTPFNHVGS